LSIGDEMPNGLRARHHRVCFEPAARLDHVNLTRLGPFLHERYLSGLLIAASRARRWSWWRRLAYFCLGPLLPAVYLSRVRAGVWAQRRDAPVPAGTFAVMLVGTFLKAAGEMVGYAGGAAPAAEPRMTEYELHKLAYASTGQQ
jgi:hypothetical protein